MNDSHHHRWKLGFVVHRWRHLWWALPGTALLVMLVLHWEDLRLDRVRAVVQVRPASWCAMSGGGSGPAISLADAMSMVTSPKVLQKAVKDSGLTETWQMTEAQAACELRSQMSCEFIPGTAQLEVKVHKMPDVDLLAICGAILKHAHEAAAAEQTSAAGKELSRRGQEVGKFQNELWALRADCEDEVKRCGALSKVLADSFESKQRLMDQVQLKLFADRILVSQMEAPTYTLEAPHWPLHPGTHQLKRFLIPAGWVVGGEFDAGGGAGLHSGGTGSTEGGEGWAPAGE